MWEFDDSCCTVVIYYHGVHTCVSNAQRVMSKEIQDDAASKFKADRCFNDSDYEDLNVSDKDQSDKDESSDLSELE